MTAQIRFEFIKRELADLCIQFPADGFGKLCQAPVRGAGLNHKKFFRFARRRRRPSSQPNPA